jgi:ABC-type transporter Mla subunit MlaD
MVDCAVQHVATTCASGVQHVAQTCEQSVQNSTVTVESSTQKGANMDSALHAAQSMSAELSTNLDELLQAVLRSVNAESVPPDQLLQHLELNAQPLVQTVLSAISSSAGALAQHIATGSAQGEATLNSREQPSQSEVRLAAPNIATSAAAMHTVLDGTPVPMAQEPPKAGIEILRSMGFQNDAGELGQLLAEADGNVQAVIDILLARPH